MLLNPKKKKKKKQKKKGNDTVEWSKASLFSGFKGH
jgi:hypothetical protein